MSRRVPTPQRGRDPDSRPAVRRRAWMGLARGFSLAFAVALLSSTIFAEAPPSVLLYGATLDGARSFAVDTTASRGWSIRSVGANTAVFEQSLEADSEGEEPTILRVFADFSEESSGIRVFLRAEEISSPESADEITTDVTDRYTENLDNALASLKAKWDAAREDQSTATESRQRASMGALASPPKAPGSQQIGVWAYAAEQYAKSRGCQPGDKPTTLEASGQGLERHKVSCSDGSEFLVDCRHGDCTSRP